MKQDITQVQERKLTRSQIARRCLLFWTLFIGIGAVAGATMMLYDPSGKAMGMDALLPYFQVLPFANILFRNLIFSGFALLIVNGVTNLTAALLLYKKRKCGVVLGGVFGITLMLWICIQFVIFPLNFMSAIYFIFGFCQATCGYMAWVRKFTRLKPPNAPKAHPAFGGADGLPCTAGQFPLNRLQLI